MEIVIVTGMSGAGKTAALKCIEDFGYYAIDNLPVSLLVNIVDLSGEKYEYIALGIDIRGGTSFNELFSALDDFELKGIRHTIVFMDASDDVLVSRFSETRRIHPLDSEGLRVSDTIKEERRLLDPLRERSNLVVDTTNTNIHELKRKLKKLVPDREDAGSIKITVVSFGYKFGIPRDTDIVVDVRFLPNPYWEETLNGLNGRDEKVVEFVMDNEEAGEFLCKFMDLLNFMLPVFIRERRPYLTIAVGCTGGHHRSVVISDVVAEKFRESGYNVNVVHRDLAKK
ncbi:MAG: RNase adapter RapZ [Actinobacteria bacterium]|nr:RNase adapter RapZ [Actinomycetota bacterium]